MKRSSVHIAGVGIAGPGIDGSRLEGLSISAATKAMLDAGITYDDVDQSIACFLDFHHHVTQVPFDALGMRGTPISQVDNASGIASAFAWIASRQADCVLVTGLDKEVSGAKVVAVSAVLVSQSFLTSRAYLKDSAVEVKSCVRTSRVHSRSSNGPNHSASSKIAVDSALRLAGLEKDDIQIVDVQQGSDANARTPLFDFKGSRPQATAKSLDGFVSTTGLTNLLGLVWLLRGWNESVASKTHHALQFTYGADGAATVWILGRSDRQQIPEWEYIQNLRDGRERLGYNPATSSHPISKEDFEAVRSRQEYTTDSAARKLQLYVKGGDRAALSRL